MSLRGASAEALEELTEMVGSGLNQDDTATVGDQLFAVADVLRADASIRRVVTDSSIETEAKQGLVRQLFQGKVEKGTLDVLLAAAERRWVASVDLPAALERLSEIALAKSVGAKSDQLVDELFAAARAIATDAELRDALANPGRTVEDRAQLAENIFGGAALPATVTLVKQALGGTYGTISAALETYREVVASVRGESVATVRVVKPLADADREKLRAALAKQYGRPVHLNEIIDPSVIGGVRVEIADDVIDGTVVNRLDEARRRLAG
jgi:F-type H+-transporting ATPase subunit delta